MGSFTIRKRGYIGNGKRVHVLDVFLTTAITLCGITGRLYGATSKPVDCKDCKSCLARLKEMNREATQATR